VNDPVSKDAAKRIRTRRRRTWYRRRLRMRRTLLAVFFGTLLAGACWQNVASYFSPPSWHGSQPTSASFWLRGNVHNNLALLAASPKPAKFIARIPGVYPYSVIPGGVKDPDDLRYAALRDYVVRRHFAHFDYSHAQLIRAEAREVYLSYRIRDTVFWTRKKIRLHAGELLLTDGKITARARCGNQISDTAKPEVSEEEPDEDVLDQPVGVAAAPSLSARPMLAPADLPAIQATPPKLFAWGFVFPYVPVGVPLSAGLCPIGDTVVDEKCHQKRHHVTPEPSTMLLISSGLALILWRYRRTLRPVAASSVSS
jgi:hypothetical protein